MFVLFEFVRYAGIISAGETAVVGHLVGLVAGSGMWWGGSDFGEVGTPLNPGVVLRFQPAVR